MLTGVLATILFLIIVMVRRFRKARPASPARSRPTPTDLDTVDCDPEMEIAPLPEPQFLSSPTTVKYPTLGRGRGGGGGSGGHSDYHHHHHAYNPYTMTTHSISGNNTLGRNGGRLVGRNQQAQAATPAMMSDYSSTPSPARDSVVRYSTAVAAAAAAGGNSSGDGMGRYSSALAAAGGGGPVGDSKYSTIGRHQRASPAGSTGGMLPTGAPSAVPASPTSIYAPGSTYSSGGASNHSSFVDSDLANPRSLTLSNRSDFPLFD